MMPPRIGKMLITGTDGKVYAVAGQTNNIADLDLDYWATKRKSLNKSMFSPESLLMKILPYIPHIIAGVLVIFILYILMSYLPSVLSQLKELVTELNKNNQATVVTTEAVTQLWRSLI